MREGRLRLASTVHLAHQDGAWHAFGAIVGGRTQLAAAELEACLWLLRHESVDPEPMHDRLIGLGILVPDGHGTEGRSRRTAWSGRGWSAAFDFVVDLYARDVAARPPAWRDNAPSGGVVQPITDPFPGTPSAPALSSGRLHELLAAPRVGASERGLVIVVAALAVRGLAPRWYGADLRVWPDVDPEQVAAMISSAGLRELVPVAFGRSGFPVEALMVVATHEDRLVSGGPATTARTYVDAGRAMSALEAAASDAGIAFRANYAVSPGLAHALSSSSRELVALGAVALGSRW